MRACLLALLMAPLAARAEEPPSPAELVRRLGDDSFETRREAAAQLEALGAAAIPAVRAGLEGRDLEVRRWCRRLLPRLVAAGREAKLEALVADVEGKGKHDFPGWERFRKEVGADAAARQLFARAVRADAALLEASEGGAKAAGPLVAKRCAGLQLKVVSPEHDATLLGEVAALAFVLTDRKQAPDRASVAAFHAGLEALAHRPALIKEVRGAPAFRKLLATALRERAAVAADGAVSAALELGLTEAVGWAAALAADRKAPAITRARALLLVGALGDRSAAPALGALLEDTAPVGSRTLGRARLTAELRDVALATLIRLHGEKEADYGFPYPRALPGLKVVPDPACLGFSNPAERTAALERWRARAARGGP
jgi:hypothetical protein